MKYISFILLLALVSCSANIEQSAEVSSTNSTTQTTTLSSSTISTENLESGTYEEKEVNIDLKSSDTIEIELDNDNTEINNESIQISGQIITIKKSGNYEFSGELNNGQIVVETDDEKDVQIILNNVNIENNFGPAIYVKNANQLVLTLVEGTVNSLSDGEDYNLEGDEGSGAAIFSKDDLVIVGEGKLNVLGNFQDGIVSKDKLYIIGGDISVDSIDDGIRGKDYLFISDAKINIDSESDGLKSNNEEEATIIINSGDITIMAGDDAIHSDVNIVFNGGNVNILSSYEGIEARYITFNDGNIEVVSSDDGINATYGSTTSTDTQEAFGGREEMVMSEGFEEGEMMMPQGERPEFTGEMSGSGRVRPDFANREDGNTNMRGWGGGGLMDQDDGSIVYFNGGNVVLNSNGDGFDSNGKIIMTGGKITIYGPVGNGNGSIDYNGSFEINGGELIAIGSAGMVQTPEESETVNSLSINLDNSYQSGSNVILKDSDGNIIYEIDSRKSFQNVIFSSSSLILNETYTLEIDGESLQVVTLSDNITQVGSSSGFRGRPW